MSATLYGRSALRIARRRRRLGTEERLVFVVGSPRSGTTFTGSALGSLPGFVDLDEVQPWKAAIPALIGQPEDEGRARLRGDPRARAPARPRHGSPRRRADARDELRARRGAAGVPAGGRRPRDPRRPRRRHLAPRARLAERRAGGRRRRRPFRSAPHARFWVEPGREDEFAQASDATRAAWAWRRYVTAAGAVPERTVEVRYEQLVADPAAAAAPVAARSASSAASSRRRSRSRTTAPRVAGAAT